MHLERPTQLLRVQEKMIRAKGCHVPLLVYVKPGAMPRTHPPTEGSDSVVLAAAAYRGVSQCR